MYGHHGHLKKKKVIGATVNFWRPVAKVGRQFSFINFWFSKFRLVSRIRSRILIGHQMQSFEARNYSSWIWALYICIIDCVKENLDQTLRSGFSISDARSNCTHHVPLCKHSTVQYILYRAIHVHCTKGRHMCELALILINPATHPPGRPPGLVVK